MNNLSELKEFFDQQYDQLGKQGFIEYDPIIIPHQFNLKQDIEIAGFFASILAWGQRTTIINKCRELMDRMDNSPFQFISGHSDSDLKNLLGFKHRTFNETDLLYFVEFLKYHYSKHESLEVAFSKGMKPKDNNIENALTGFRNYFFSLEYFPERTQKHISTPTRNSACKRLNMFLRWMVRKDKYGIDFNIWKKIKPNQLICPLDVHVDRVARKFKLIHRKQTNWKTALELTENLKKLDSEDPIKYDIVLFSLGVNERNN